MNSLERKIREMKQRGVAYTAISVELDINLSAVTSILKRGVPELGRRCAYCRDTTALHGHHLDYINNEVITLCAKCHAEQHNRQREDTRIDFLLPKELTKKLRRHSRRLGVPDGAVLRHIIKEYYRAAERRAKEAATNG